VDPGKAQFSDCKRATSLLRLSAGQSALSKAFNIEDFDFLIRQVDYVRLKPA
jgi:hypothetical protein